MRGRAGPGAASSTTVPAAYSSLTVTPRGTIGLFYERGDLSSIEHITFARFNLAWVTQSVPVLDPSGLPNADHPDLWAWFAADVADSVNGPGQDADGAPLTRWDDISAGGFHGPDAHQ